MVLRSESFFNAVSGPFMYDLPLLGFKVVMNTTWSLGS